MTLFLLQRTAVTPTAGRPTCRRAVSASGSFISIPHMLATRCAVRTWITTCAVPTDACPQADLLSPRVTNGNVMKSTLKLTALIAVFGCVAYGYDARGEALVAIPTTASTLRLAIDPQSLPPRYPRDPIPTNTSLLSGAVIAINPQPLPPDRHILDSLFAEKTMPVIPAPLDEPPMMPVPLRVASIGQATSVAIA